MLITKNYVYLNFPKTGTTFLRDVIKEAYFRKHPLTRYLGPLYKFGILQSPVTELFLPNLHSPIPQSRSFLGQHGAYSQIPAIHAQKPVITIARNPYELFISTYISKWWLMFNPVGAEETKKLFPDFPQLDLSEYIQLVKLSVDADPSLKLGSLSIQFIRMYFKDPEKVLANISLEYLASGEYKKDMGDNITFLRQENLNDELAEILEREGFTKTETNFIQNYQRQNTGKLSSEHKQNTWTAEAIEYVEEYERFLLKVLYDMGFDYKKPEQGQPIFKEK